MTGHRNHIETKLLSLDYKVAARAPAPMEIHIGGEVASLARVMVKLEKGWWRR